MNILLSNDDGITAKGIHVLADALAQMDDVNLYVCAPDRQRSCCGHALTMHDSLFVKDHDTSEFNNKVLWAAECTGVPADCVRIALHILQKRGIKIDLVCAGINMGSNYGTDVFYSGTLAAAREGAICHTQAIAFSLASHDAENFELFYKLVPQVVNKSYGKLPVDTILNVNVPDIPVSELKGVKICRLGPMDYTMEYQEPSENEYSMPYDVIVGNHTDMSYDLVAGEHGYVTLTACEVFPHNPNADAAVEKLGINLD